MPTLQLSTASSTSQARALIGAIASKLGKPRDVPNDQRLMRKGLERC